MRKAGGFPQMAHLWGLVILGGVFAFINTHPIRPHDFWWHMAYGRQIVETGNIPTVDTFSFTASGQPYASVAMFWLPDVMLYGLYSLGGAALVIFVHSLSITLAYGVVLWVGWQEGRNGRAAAVGALAAAALGLNDWNVRPQGFAFLLGALVIAAMFALRRGGGRGWLVVLALAMVVWANTHGSFVVGLLLAGFWLFETVVLRIARIIKPGWIRWLGPRVDLVGAISKPAPIPSARTGMNPRATSLRRMNPARAARLNAKAGFVQRRSIARRFITGLSGRLIGQLASLSAQEKSALAAFFISVTAVCLNPRGVGVYGYLLTMMNNPTVQNLTSEWAPPAFNTLAGGLFLGALLLMILVLILSPRRPAVFEVTLLVVFGALSLKTSRFIVWFGLVAAPIIAGHWSGLAEKYTRKSAHEPVKNTLLLNRMLAGTLLLLGLVSLPWYKSALPLPAAKAALVSTETPIAAVDWLLAEKPAGPLFHSMPYGSYLIWAAQPDYPVFVDARIELYSPAVWDDYLSISGAVEGWLGRLDRYGVRTLLLSRADQPLLAAAAAKSQGWERVYEDDEALIFVRR